MKKATANGARAMVAASYGGALVYCDAAVRQRGSRDGIGGATKRGRGGGARARGAGQRCTDAGDEKPPGRILI